MSQPLIVTGANVLVYVNGKRFGRCVGMDWGASTPSKEIRGIDYPEPIELAPTTSGVHFTLTIWRTKGDGGIEGLGIQAPGTNIARGKYFSVMLIERTSDTVIFQADNCRVEDQSWSHVSKTMVQGRVSCKALTWNNEVKSLRK